MTQVPVLPFERSDDRVIAGVCGGIASSLRVDPTLVRLVFAILSLAGGAGILLYFALWAWTGGSRPIVGVLILALATMALLGALGVSIAVILGAGLLAAGVVLLARRGATIRPGGPSLFLPGIALAVGGAVVMLDHIGPSRSFVAPGALAGALALVLAPWVWELSAERRERIRLEERSAMASRIHDSVLQTLALVQREANDPHRVRSLARRQERELRSWLYGSGVSAATLSGALADAAADVEDAHGIRVELTASGDLPLDDALSQLVLAAREAMANAGKHSGVDEVSAYAEVEPDAVTVWVRDRGAGFDRAAVAADRRGIAESIEARMARAGGTAFVVSTAGEGTEVELTLPRSGS